MFPGVSISKVCAVSLLFAGVHPVCHTLSWAVPTRVSLSQRGEPAHGGSAHTQWWHWCWECGVYVLAESRMLWGKTLWYRDSEIYVLYNPVEIGHENGYRACFCSSRSESSRNDCTPFKHNPRGKDSCLQSQPAAFGMVHKDQISPFCSFAVNLYAFYLQNILACAFRACPTSCATVKQAFIYKKPILDPERVKCCAVASHNR